MADSAEAEEIYWVEPKLRGIFDIGHIHISRSLRRALLREDYDIRINSDFTSVVTACANRDTTWISAEIKSLYSQLHQMGFAHSIEVWRDDDLIGGVYGVTLGSAFFGESMFSGATNGSKIALVYLMAILVKSGFKLFDTQFITDHLASLGAIEIPKKDYKQRLSKALMSRSDFTNVEIPDAQAAIQLSTQTS